MGTMTAARYDRFGGPEVLHVVQVPRPEPRSDEVLVRVRATSINGADAAARAGQLRLLTGRRFPQATGVDLAGEVVDLGPDVDDLAVGDRVWGLLGRSRFGSAAEYVSVPAARLGLVPAGMDLTEAVALPAGGTTAITALRDTVRLRSGESLLVRGASGGVGSAAVQLGRAYGAEVTGLARTANHDLVRELGARHTVDHRDVSPAELGRFDVVLDTVGTHLNAYRALLRPGGRMVTVAPHPTNVLATVAVLATSTVHGSRRVRMFSGDPKRPLLDDLATYVADGRLRPQVDTVFPLDDIAAAHRAFADGGVRGKIVVRVGG
jgi:NADPH:quinone reductase-like Zn-dependent oxidoreductase